MYCKTLLYFVGYRYIFISIRRNFVSNNQLLLQECINQEFQDNSNFSSESEFFEFFATAQTLKNYNLSDEEIVSGLTGGTLDGGCDAIYTFLNGDLIKQDQVATISAPKGSTLSFLIFQAKNTTSFNEDAIMKWKVTSNNLFDMNNPITDYADRYNEQVRESFGMFRDIMTKLVRSQIKVQIAYYYVTRADEIHPNVMSQADELIKNIKHIYPNANIEVQFITADRLMELYNTDGEVSINISLADQPIGLGNKVDYVALVKLPTYYKFITDDNGIIRKSFFEANVRDYQGNNSVNSAIANSLLNKGAEDFWWLNNGVTILADSITHVNNRELLLVNPEIVNGLQTSTEIYKYFAANPELINSDDRNLLIRFIVPENEQSRDNIIYSTNNQTSISKSSLRVTDPIHLQIELYFKSRGLYYDRRKNYYKNQRKKASEIVSVSFLAQCLISLILRKPDFARARPSTLLTDDETYAKLYENTQDLEAYYKSALIGKKIQAFLVDSAIDSVIRNDIIFYVLYASIAKILNKKEITFSDLHNLDDNLITYDIMNEVKDKIYLKYEELGNNSRVAKNPSFITEVYKLLGFD